MYPNRRPPCRYFQWVHTPLYPLPSDPTPEWLVKFTASSQQLSFKPRPLKSVTKQTQTEWLQQDVQNVEQWKREQANKAWLNQFAESAQKQQEHEQQAKKKEFLPRTSQFSPRIEGLLKPKHDEWKPPLGSETFDKNENKESFG